MGGELTAKARQRREAVRPKAAALFDEGIKPPEVARQLRVSRKSVLAQRLWSRHCPS
ncbi:Putative IS630 family ISBs2-like transposase [Streptomyces sp. 769]|nr:Putative IS630 family ISBs2-like transposase [Streptomyces sp. 769]